MRIVQPKRLLPVFPGITTRCKSLVIDPSAYLKLLLKQALLAFCEPEPVVVCGFKHIDHTV